MAELKGVLYAQLAHPEVGYLAGGVTPLGKTYGLVNCDPPTGVDMDGDTETVQVKHFGVEIEEMGEEASCVFMCEV